MISYKETFTTKFPTYIYSYTSSIGRIEDSTSKYITRAFPTHLTQLLFEFCGDLSTIKTKQNTTNITKRTYVNAGIGEWIDIFQLESKKNIRDVKNFKVDLYPHVLYEVFNISPREILLDDLHVRDIWRDKDDADAMIEKLALAQDNDGMVSIFEYYFLKQLLSAKQKDSYSKYFLQQHNDLYELSKEVGYSKRWIQLQYKEVFGLSFKGLQSNMRFLKVLDQIDKLILQNKSVNFSYLAVSYGYYDQAHFIKEFKHFTGLTPAKYVKEKFDSNVKFFW
jgi:AraC-like DNA-binding protein